MQTCECSHQRCIVIIIWHIIYNEFVGFYFAYIYNILPGYIRYLTPVLAIYDHNTFLDMQFNVVIVKKTIQL